MIIEWYLIAILATISLIARHWHFSCVYLSIIFSEVSLNAFNLSLIIFFTLLLLSFESMCVSIYTHIHIHCFFWIVVLYMVFKHFLPVCNLYSIIFIWVFVKWKILILMSFNLSIVPLLIMHLLSKISFLTLRVLKESYFLCKSFIEFKGCYPCGVNFLIMYEVHLFIFLLINIQWP
jgi:hypothetical protein